ncbi:MAG: hypothetical protein ACJAZ0_002519 [Halioglobus sp.]|jgi:hypothetical protein
MNLWGCTVEVIRVASYGTCVYVLAVCLGSSFTLAEELPGPAVPAQETHINSDELQVFRSAIAGAESTDGAYARLLPQQLLGLGIALQKKSRHADAVAVFKRGSHLARIHNGLSSSAQIPYIQHKITSHIALGQFSEADKAQGRLFRVQSGRLSSTEIEVQVLLQQARWQHQAYELGIGAKAGHFKRLMNMWDLNHMALTGVIDREGDTSANVLPPLYGLLRSQYLISGHRDGSISPAIDSEYKPGQEQRRFNRFVDQNYDLGRSVIHAIYKVQVSQYGEASLATVQARVMMGDWMLWHNAYDSAMDAYSLAIGELEGLDDAQLHTEHLFGSPKALPDLEGIRPPQPLERAEAGSLLVEFEVSRKGTVADIVRLESASARSDVQDIEFEKSANRLMRSLTRTKFRPRFVDGVAIKTEKIIKAYAIAR